MTLWIVVPPIQDRKNKPSLCIEQERKPQFGTKRVKSYTSGTIMGFEFRENAISHLERMGVPYEMIPDELKD
jgi:hypothetical protein